MKIDINYMKIVLKNRYELYENRDQLYENCIESLLMNNN